MGLFRRIFGRKRKRRRNPSDSTLKSKMQEFIDRYVADNRHQWTPDRQAQLESHIKAAFSGGDDDVWDFGVRGNAGNKQSVVDFGLQHMATYDFDSMLSESGGNVDPKDKALNDAFQYQVIDLFKRRGLLEDQAGDTEERLLLQRQTLAGRNVSGQGFTDTSFEIAAKSGGLDLNLLNQIRAMRKDGRLNDEVIGQMPGYVKELVGRAEASPGLEPLSKTAGTTFTDKFSVEEAVRRDMGLPANAVGPGAPLPQPPPTTAQSLDRGLEAALSGGLFGKQAKTKRRHDLQSLFQGG